VPFALSPMTTIGRTARPEATMRPVCLRRGSVRVASRLARPLVATGRIARLEEAARRIGARAAAPSPSCCWARRGPVLRRIQHVHFVGVGARA